MVKRVILVIPFAVPRIQRSIDGAVIERRADHSSEHFQLGGPGGRRIVMRGRSKRRRLISVIRLLGAWCLLRGWVRVHFGEIRNCGLRFAFRALRFAFRALILL
jgi:hypothetical protein